MDKNPNHAGVTAYHLIQLCLDLKEEMASLKTFARMSVKKPSEQIEEEWLDSQQVMRLLKIKKGTLQNLRDEGILGFTPIKGKIYYKSDDVAMLLKTNYRKRVK